MTQRASFFNVKRNLMVSCKVVSVYIRVSDFGDNVLTIGKLALAAGTEDQTIRYYESIGVLPQPDRNCSGYRIYEETAIGRLQFIKRAKDVGFTLKEIRTLISLAESSNIKCDEVQEFVENKLTRVREQIKHLKEIECGLGELVGQCRSADTIDNCPTLNKLINGKIVRRE